MTREEHQRELEKLRSMENILANLIASRGRGAIMNAFLNWQEQRDKCNEVFLSAVETIFEKTPESIERESQISKLEEKICHQEGVTKNNYLDFEKAINDSIERFEKTKLTYNGNPCKNGCNCIEIAEYEAGGPVKNYECKGGFNL